MNRDRFGWTRRPFRATPTLDLFVPLPTHEHALSRLRNAFDSDEGFAILDGGPGTGKTRLALRFLESLGDSILPIYLPSARLTRPTELLQSILFDLNRPYQGLSDQELRLSLVDALFGAMTETRRAVLVLDEAQLLANEVLEEIRLLDNWEARGRKALFTVLVAQPELRSRLQNPEHAPLASRMHTKIALEPLSNDDSRQFVLAQLEQCGNRPDEIIDAEALTLLVRGGRGNPRLLNRIASEAFEIAKSADMDSVDLEVVYEALTRVGIDVEQISESSQPATPIGPLKSRDRTPDESPVGNESKPPRSPKQKSRSRRVA